MFRKPMRCDRRGATAVEFAIVAPVLLGFLFVIIELAMLMMFSGNVNTAMLLGLRSLTLSESNAAEVETVIRTELEMRGISTATIEFDPVDFDVADPQVDLLVDVPINAENGLGLTWLLSSGGPRSIRRTITVERESR